MGASKAAVKLFTEGAVCRSCARPRSLSPSSSPAPCRRVITENSGVSIPGGEDAAARIRLFDADDIGGRTPQRSSYIRRGGSYRVLVGKDARGLDALACLYFRGGPPS